MATIEERAKEYAENEELVRGTEEFEYCQRDYIAGATIQKAIDIEKAKNACNKTFGWLSTYPSCESWYNELFDNFMKNMEE